jgi:hypothetical protein
LVAILGILDETVPDDPRELAGGERLVKAAGGNGSASAPPTIVVVQHFDEELKRLVPVK